jgi:acetylcholinesterase
MPLTGLQFHISDVPIVYGGKDLTDYLVRFATTLDPNGGNTDATEINWPRYTLDSPQLLTLLDGNTPLAITNDTFRREAMDVMIEFSLANLAP